MTLRALLSSRLVAASKQVARRPYTVNVAPEVQAEIDATKAHAEKTAELWRKLTLFGFFPVLGISGYIVYGMAAEHMHHLHEHPPKFVAYDYLRVRRRPFPWADSDHTLFHNSLVNPDPEE
ncbi:hypothetical protein H4R35_006913 [Dimargaris xerosporica]|nr:hypothetical protein H4R35_006913 [Dimargaris xerosporica]